MIRHRKLNRPRSRIQPFERISARKYRTVTETPPHRPAKVGTAGAVEQQFYTGFNTYDDQRKGREDEAQGGGGTKKNAADPSSARCEQI